MPHIIVPKRSVWTRQPPLLAPIAGGSLSDGLLACITPFGDHVTRRLLAVTGTPAREVTADGEAIKFVNANSYGLSLGSADRYNPTEMTIFAVVNVAAVGTRVLWARDAIANRAFALDVESGWRFYVAGGAPILTTAASTGRAVVAVAMRGTTAGLYLNGTLADASASMTAMPSVNTQTTLGYRIYAGNQNYFDGSVAIAAMWKRALKAAEIRSVSLNPWQLLERSPRRLWVVPASSGAYSLTADAGSYSLTGQDVALLASRSLAAAQGSYTLTGQDAALLRLFTLTAAQGSYSLSGQAVALAASRLIAAGQGSYTLTGQAVGLLASWVLAAGQGAYALTGQAAGLTYTPLGSYSLLADAGSYTLTGQAVGLLASRVLAAAAGSYSLSGQDVGLTYTPAGASYTLTADAGGYALTGQDIAFARTYVLTAASGSYTLTGRAVTFSYSGAPTATVQDMLRTARGVARLAARGAARNTIRGYRP